MEANDLLQRDSKLGKQLVARDAGLGAVAGGALGAVAARLLSSTNKEISLLKTKVAHKSATPMEISRLAELLKKRKALMIKAGIGGAVVGGVAGYKLNEANRYRTRLNSMVDNSFDKSVGKESTDPEALAELANTKNHIKSMKKADLRGTHEFMRKHIGEH